LRSLVAKGSPPARLPKTGWGVEKGQLLLAITAFFQITISTAVSKIAKQVLNLQVKK